MVSNIDVVVEDDSLAATIYKIIVNRNIMSEKIIGFQQIEDLIGDFEYTIEPSDTEASLFKLTIKKEPFI